MGEKRQEKKTTTTTKTAESQKKAQRIGDVSSMGVVYLVYIIQVMDTVGYCKLIKGPIAASIGVPRVVYHFKKFPEIPFGKLTEHDFLLMFQRKISALRNI